MYLSPPIVLLQPWLRTLTLMRTSSVHANYHWHSPLALSKAMHACMTTSYKPPLCPAAFGFASVATFGLALLSPAPLCRTIPLCLLLPPLALPLSPCLLIYLASPQLHACHLISPGPIPLALHLTTPSCDVSCCVPPTVTCLWPHTWPVTTRPLGHTPVSPV